MAMLFPAKITSSCIWLPYLLIELFYISLLVLQTDGRSVVRSVYGHVITKFSGMDRFSYPWCRAASPDFMKRNKNATPC